MTALPLPAAARALGVSERQLRRFLRDGAPVARRGGRGRGRATLIDVEAVRAWRARPDDRLRQFAGEVPELVAEAAEEAFQLVEGPQKRAAAGILAGAWYVTTTRLLGRLRGDLPDLQDPSAIPPPIERLREIAGRK